MKKLLFAFCALCLLPFAAMADGISTGCDNGPTLTHYELPRDADGSIVFAGVRSFGNEELFNSLPVAASGDLDEMRWADPQAIEITPIGSPDCLAVGSADIHRLVTGYGKGIDLPNEAALKDAIYQLERAAFEEGVRVEDAYLGKSSS